MAAHSFDASSDTYANRPCSQPASRAFLLACYTLTAHQFWPLPLLALLVSGGHLGISTALMAAVALLALPVGAAMLWTTRRQRRQLGPALESLRNFGVLQAGALFLFLLATVLVLDVSGLAPAGGLSRGALGVLALALYSAQLGLAVRLARRLGQLNSWYNLKLR